MPEFTKEALRVLEWTVIDAVKIGTRKLREEITEQLTKIERKLEDMPSQQDLDNALDTLMSAITEAANRVSSDLKALQDKLAATPAAPDLSAEVARVQSGIDAIKAIDPANPAPVPAPAPEPAPAPAPAVQQTTPSGAPLPPTPEPPPEATTPAP